MEFVDGKPVSQCDKNRARISAFGDGIFETIFFHAGRPHLLDLHLQRMQQGASRLGLPFCPATVQSDLNAFIDYYKLHSATCRVRLLLSRAYSAAGYSVKDIKTRLLINAGRQEFPDFAPLDVIVSQIQLARQPLLAGIKHCNRLENIMARQALDGSAYGEALLLDQCGNVIECSAANVFILKRNELITPRLDNAGVAGVMRQFLMTAVAGDMGLEAMERELALSELFEADAVFVCSALRGVNAVKRLVSGNQCGNWDENGLVKQIQQRVAASMANSDATAV